MPHSPSAYTQDTVANTDDDDLTQASLSPGSMGPFSEAVLCMLDPVGASSQLCMMMRVGVLKAVGRGQPLSTSDLQYRF
ncbi:hypothetical protein MKX07_000298 [Trichoderma sp. CBMAI-0711]|nr:hypothetical protein MKX07_000298 [Trichoderma sp. CBMAI-0711]